MENESGYEITTTYILIFPSLKLPSSVEEIGNVEVKSRNLIRSEPPKVQRFLEYAFALFKDPFGNPLSEGIYIVHDESKSVKETRLLLQFAALIPDRGESLHNLNESAGLMDSFEFYLPQHKKDNEKELEISSVDWNDTEIWNSFSGTGFFPFIQRLYDIEQVLTISKEGLSLSGQLANLFSYEDEYDIETIKLQHRLRKAIYWYNESCKKNFSGWPFGQNSFWDLENQILYMAIAFETLFQPSKENIQKHLGISLSVIFPDNELVLKWLSQFYSARSAIVHGSLLKTKAFEFKPDKSEHQSLIYWSRKIFRTCIEATIHQWESARKSGLLKMMTPNRIRINRILGKLRSTKDEVLLKAIPDDIATDIQDLHASRMDIPNESYLEQTHSIGVILCTLAIKSTTLTNKKLKEQCKKILSLPQDWYKAMKHRSIARHNYTAIIGMFGDDASSLTPPIQLNTKNKLEQILYHWAKFAYAHIWSIDI